MPRPKQRYRQGSETNTIPNGCQGEAEWLAANGNTEHASPLKAKEYRRIFQVRAARQEGFDEIAYWFETLAKAGKSHAGRFRKALDAL